MLALVASATNPSVNLSGCKSERTRDGDAIWCPVTDTSRPCKWQFTDLPEGWTSKGDRIFAPRGSIEDGKLYGFKVSLLNAITNLGGGVGGNAGLFGLGGWGGSGSNTGSISGGVNTGSGSINVGQDQDQLVVQLVAQDQTVDY